MTDSKPHSEHLDLCRDIVTGWVAPNVAGDVLKLKMAQEYISLFEQLEALREERDHWKWDNDEATKEIVTRAERAEEQLETMRVALTKIHASAAFGSFIKRTADEALLASIPASSPFPQPALESEEKSLWPDREIPGKPADSYQESKP